MSRKLELQWSQPFVVKDVTGFYKDLLPIIVKVDEGYNGITDEETYSRDDMYIITEVRQQKRVAALALKKHHNQTCVHISVPVISNARFHVLQSDGSKTENAETLLDIERRIGLTEDMTLLPDVNNPVEFNQFIGDGKPGKPIIFGELTVTNVFSQDYLIGFPLPELQTPHELTAIFPVHMDLKLKVADSLDGGTKRDFKMFMDFAYRKTSNLKHDVAIHGTTEIMLYSEEMGDEDPYEYAHPADYIRFSVLTQPNHKPTVPEDIPKRRNSSYEHVELEDASPKPNSDHSKPRAPDPISDDEEGDYYEIKGNMSQLIKSRDTIPSKSSDEDIIEKDEQIMTEKKGPPSVAVDPNKNDITQMLSRKWPRSEMTDKPSGTDVEANTSYTGQHSCQMLTSDKSKLSLGLSMPSSSVPCTPCLESPSSSVQQNTKPTIVVAPRVRGTSDITDEAPPRTQEPLQIKAEERQAPIDHAVAVDHTEQRSQSPECVYKSFAEIPKDISHLGQQEIAACLRRMNMDKYVDEFKTLQIDGTLLLALSEDDLKNDFGMTKTEVKKIGLFAHKQWRPNTI